MPMVRVSNGGSMTGTPLWTNPNPSAGYGGGTVTLSDSITNYKYIRFEWKALASQPNTTYMIAPSEEVANWIEQTSSGASPNGSFGAYFYDNAYNKGFMLRGFYKVSNTQIAFGRANQIGTTAYNDVFCVPIKISGIK